VFSLGFLRKICYHFRKGVSHMHYSKMVSGIFLARPNRFIAHVQIDGKAEVCHVKNTGRCRELLPMGAKVWCAVADNPHRKTKFDLITVEKGHRLINMDSQAPNIAAKEWLLGGGLGTVENLRAETVHGDSRFDFSFTLDGKPCFLEVKGVTLENDGICAFPDAPTVRGARHLQELTEAVKNGFGTYVLFVIQMENVLHLHPHDATDPAFGAALRQASAAGVQVLAMECNVTPDTMEITRPVEVRL
jgi:sugar fermentation stimulation protein A